MADARSLALRRLSVREYSAIEMVRYLKRKGVEESDAEALVAELVKNGLIDDRRYAAVVARSQGLKGKGPMQILAKLKQKGVSLELDEVRRLYGENFQEDESEAIQKILKRRYPGYQYDKNQQRRAYQMLMRRGFSPDAIIRCLKVPIDD